MFDTHDTFDTAMVKVAERLLLAREKRAAATPEQVAQSMSARQSLGILGANQDTVNNVSSGVRDRRMTPVAGVDMLRRSVPGSATQFANVPSSIATALSQGRVDEAASQADVLGTKNVNPFSRYFSPTTVAASTLAALAAWKLKNHIASNLQDRRNVYQASADGLKGFMPKNILDEWKAWRASPAAATAENNSWQKLRDAFTGLPMNPKAVAMFRSAANAAAAKAKTPAGGSLLGTLGHAAVPAAAAAVPMAAREWLGRGYRSGDQPARDLVQASTPTRQGGQS